MELEVRAGNDTLGPFPKLRGTGTFGAARNFAQPSSSSSSRMDASRWFIEGKFHATILSI